jgi:hypothetical protein
MSERVYEVQGIRNLLSTNNRAVERAIVVLYGAESLMIPRHEGHCTISPIFQSCNAVSRVQCKIERLTKHALPSARNYWSARWHAICSRVTPTREHPHSVGARAWELV